MSRPVRFLALLGAVLITLGAARPAPRIDDHGTSTFAITWATGDSTPRVIAGSVGNVSNFFIENLTGSTQTATLSCSGSGVTSCIVDGPTYNLAPWEKLDLVATYTAGTSGLHKTLTITATGGAGGSGSISLQLLTSRVNLVAPWPSSALTTHRSRPVVRGNFSLVAGEETDTGSIRLWWRGVERTTQVRKNGAFVEWEVGAADSLVPGDSAQLKIRHCLTAGPVSCGDAIAYVKMPNDSTPVLDFTGMPYEVTASGATAPLGTGVAAHGAEVETGFATPAYVTMNTPRSASLVYSTRTSYPRALVAANIKLPWPTGTPDSVKAVLFDGAVRKDSFAIGATGCATGSFHACRVVLQAEYSSGAISGGVSRRWLTVQASVKSGGSWKTTTDSVETVLVDRRDSPYGSGWWPGVGTRLYLAGSDRVLVGPGGGAAIFRGSGDSVYLSPTGETSTLVKVATGFELRSRVGSAKVVFDTGGRFIKAVDISGNRDSVTYDGSGRISAQYDPVGFHISYYYGSVTGKLDSIVSLAGTSGKRFTRISIDTATNQLRYDSLSSPASHPILGKYSYLTYGSQKGTAQLRTRTGRYGSDSVMVLYDTTTSTPSNRVVQSRLMAATSGGPVPVLAYQAAELQGWRSYRSLDSVYTQGTDPLGHWTRSRLNRWGASTMTWDSLGTLGEVTYDDIGLLLSTEGKNGDSSRVYSAYDAQSRLVKTYIVRSASDTLRLDSLVYDWNGRVMKHVDSRGKVDSTAYDAAGRPNYHQMPNGGYTIIWYRSNGLVDSSASTASSGILSNTYDGTYLNLAYTTDESGGIPATVTNDSMGRTKLTEGKIRIATTGTSTQWQWRRTRTWLDAAGATDSVATDHSTSCADPCNSNPGYDAATLHVTKYTRDSLGQVTQIVLPTGTYSSLHDRLGRVVRSTPPGTGSDSMVYDLAGNVTKSINRLGDSVKTWYDSRNRVDSVSVPRYGVVHHTFGGPLDQLTRTWVTGYVDSLGNVNPNRSYVYDARGRLTKDTLWTGPVARVTTHSYDTYERPVTDVDPIGTWTKKFDAVLGIPDTLITGLGDTLSLVVDLAGRIQDLNVSHGSAVHAPFVGRSWSATGELTGLATGTASGGGYTGFNLGTLSPGYEGDGENFGVMLLPTWTKQDGSGASMETLEDTLTYDGFARLTEWKGMKGGALVDSETYHFDTAGNLTLNGDTATFATGTNRLLNRHYKFYHSTYIYDAIGNLIQRIDSTGISLTCTFWYGYDGFNNLVSVRGQRALQSPGVLVARYAYDVTGARIARRVYNQVLGGCSDDAALAYTRYAVQGGQVRYETDSAGSTIVRRYEWAPGTDDIIAAQVGSSTDSTWYAGKDKLGSVRVWVRKDGTWRWVMRYRPYGTGVDSSGTAIDVPYRWTGREYDPETGFYYNRARYYDPSVGRFMQEDPAGLSGGDNQYAYVGGHPLEATDPSGMRYAWSGTYDPGCSITSGICYNWDGTRTDPVGGAGGGGMFGGGGWGFIDSDDDGRDDFQEFAWYAASEQLFIMHGGTSAQWQQLDFALDHGQLDQATDEGIRTLAEFGRLSVKQVAVVYDPRQDRMRPVPAAAQMDHGWIILYTGDGYVNSHGDPFGFFTHDFMDKAWIVAHEYGHYLGWLSSEDYDRWPATPEERRASCYADHATGWQIAMEVGDPRSCM